MLTAGIIFKLTEMLEKHWRPPKPKGPQANIFFFLRMNIFHALAQYSYFSADSRLKIFLCTFFDRESKSSVFLLNIKAGCDQVNYQTEMYGI